MGNIRIETSHHDTALSCMNGAPNMIMLVVCPSPISASGMATQDQGMEHWVGCFGQNVTEDIRKVRQILEDKDRAVSGQRNPFGCGIYYTKNV
jgi:hypothetical protein